MSAEEVFWNWFQEHEDELFNFERDQEKIFDRLITEMHKVHRSLAFEFSPKENDRREFVISADGIKEAFPKVQSLHASAPHLPRWKFIRFRPRRKPFDIRYRGVSVKAQSVLVQVEPVGQKMDITVFVPNYTKTAYEKYAPIAFLLLDQALGEYEVETRVGAIEIEPIYKAIPPNYSLEELPKLFDDLAVPQ